MDEHDAPSDSVLREPSDAELRKLLASTRTIAVLGASARRERPAFEVPDYLSRHGYDIVPVNPRYAGTTLHGRSVLAELPQIEGVVDIVNVFRRSEDVPAHVDDILAMPRRPGAVWLQSGIRNEAAAERLREAGIQVVQDRCLKVEHRRLLGSSATGERS